MPIVPGNSERLENSVFAILSSTNRENLTCKFRFPHPCDLLDTTSPTWFKFLTISPWSSRRFLQKDGFMHGRHTATFPIILKNAGFFNSL
ncbi:unnamed protein product [Brassica rapa subsp. narinosa]|uniref:(rape) hypothetical protein n=1 Tax=Brassica napus TaxID=3708 RepID=A0A816TMQ7_BRANA|nr:unnamed protein product [Brassica napus]